MTVHASSRPQRRGRRLGLATVLVSLALSACGAPEGSTSARGSVVPAAAPAPATSSSQAAACHPGDPLAGVYHPQRLQVFEGCRTVHGTVDCIRSEPDGDLHIRLRLDDTDRGMLTPGNDLQRCPGQPGPHLVVEVIPQHCGGVPQQDAEDKCADRGGFTSPPAPAEGEHVAVTGPLVIDQAPQHGQTGSGWAEIHPAETINAG